jgi:hypothetical protein
LLQALFMPAHCPVHYTWPQFTVPTVHRQAE